MQAPFRIFFYSYCSGEQHDAELLSAGCARASGQWAVAKRPVSCRVEVDHDRRGAQVTGRATVHWHPVVFRDRAVEPEVSLDDGNIQCPSSGNNKYKSPSAGCARASGQWAVAKRPVSCRVEVDRDRRGAQVTGRATAHWHPVVSRGRAVDLDARNVSTHLRQLGHEFNEAFEQVNSAQ